MARVFAAGGFLLALSSTCAPLSGTTIAASIDPDLFGDLNQADTVCPTRGCGSAAVTNSLVYLQRKFPAIYERNLIRDSNFNGSIDRSEMVATANDIRRNSIRTTTGTLMEDFILGKRDYMERRARGKTRYAAQIWTGSRLSPSGPWRENPEDGTHPGTAKPGFVRDSTKPTLSFIATQIKAGEDLEIFVATLGGAAHYLTVTGLSYDDATNVGTMSFVDPFGGARITRNIRGLDRGFIDLDYKIDGSNTFIFSAVSESPVPEASTLLPIILSLVAIVARHSRALRSLCPARGTVG